MTDRPAGVSVDGSSWRAALTDRGVQAVILLLAGAAGGFVSLGLSWAGVAARLAVYDQLPFLVSGAFGGVALAGICLGVASVSLSRRESAAERHFVDRTLHEVAALSETLPAVLGAAAATRRPTAASAAGRAGAGARRPAAFVLPAALVNRGGTVHRSTCRIVVGRDLPPFTGSLAAGNSKACKLCRPDEVTGQG